MKFIYLLFLILLISPVYAIKGDLKLLAVSEQGDGYIGSLADLELEIKQGSGRIFIDSFPLTKLDTQISTRFAKEVACDYLDMNCNNYDFFYVIRGSASLIGGPSAGSALTTLTIALLENEKIKDDVVITGTINSGGFIGPVGGIKEKIIAAQEANLSKVLIPFGSSLTDDLNMTFNLTDFDIEVIEVSHISEVLPHFFDADLPDFSEELEIDNKYMTTMKYLSDTLCNRTEKWKDQVSNFSEIPSRVINLTKSSQIAYLEGTYYSSASYCFGSNVELSKVYFNHTLKAEDIKSSIAGLRLKIKEFKGSFPQYKTINDLEAYTAVMERLSETEELLVKAEIAFEENKTEESILNIAVANERYYSAFSWAKFFGSGGEEITIDENDLAQACILKISESDERINYLKIFLGDDLIDPIRDELKLAKRFQNQDEFEMCIYKASKTKARADIILNSVNIRNDSIKDILDKRLMIIKNNLVEETKSNHFPILGYSYYEYANSLKEEDVFSSLLYAEYALEFGNLDMYFPPKNRTNRLLYNDKFSFLAIGLLLGLISGLYFKKVNKKTRLDARGTKCGKKR
jgi:predicted S18 family serine protease